MVKELKYMLIEHTEKDLEFLKNYETMLDTISEEIVSFFKLENFGEKAKVKIFSSLEEFRSFCLEKQLGIDKNGQIPDWLCGVTRNGMFIVPTYEEYIKTKGHGNHSVEDYAYLLLHEFVHICHIKKKKTSKLGYKWFTEGLATNLSHQYSSKKPSFRATLEQIKFGTDYMSFCAMFQYVMNTYGVEYIYLLLEDDELLVQETPRLYLETKDYYDNLEFKAESSIRLN